MVSDKARGRSVDEAVARVRFDEAVRRKNLLMEIAAEMRRMKEAADSHVQLDQGGEP